MRKGYVKRPVGFKYGLKVESQKRLTADYQKKLRLEKRQTRSNECRYCQGKDRKSRSLKI